MKTTPAIAFSLMCLSTVVAADSYQTGLAELDVPNNAGRTLEGFVWYPTVDAEDSLPHHSNPVWVGTFAASDGMIAEGQFPLVVLSHGMYGNARNQGWLASALAEQGYIVAAISHPGTSTFLRDPDDARQMWERPKDISRVIDHLTTDTAFAAQIDPDRIYMGGHSLGGYTAVAVAGGRYDADAFGDFCTADPEELVCGIFGDWNIGQTPEDITQMEADLSDPRISKVAVFDLGGTQTFSTESLGQIEKDMLVISAPKEFAGSLDLDVESRALVAALPDAVKYLEPASLTHFDFLGLCTAAALDILAEEEPESVMVCEDGTDARVADHAMIAEAVSAFFAE